MIKIASIVCTMAILMTAGIATISCVDDLTGELQNPDGSIIMTVSATKGGEDAQTKALSANNSTLTATWTENDEVKVYQGDNLIGTLFAQSTGASTELKGTLTATPSNGATLTLKYLSPSYGTQDGTLTGNPTSIDKVCDYATAAVTVTDVSGNVVTTTGPASFQSQQAIVLFTLKKKSDFSDLVIPEGTSLIVNDGTNDYTVTPKSDTYQLYVAIPATNTVKLRTNIGGAIYSYDYYSSTPSGNIVAGKYSKVNVQMWREVDLSKVNAQTTLENGDKVYGTLSSRVKISIADGAEVMLDGVTINGTDSDSYQWAGLTCIGNATIVLAEGSTNTVKGFYYTYPGIQVAHNSGGEEYKLTIKGHGPFESIGSLYVSTNNNNNDYYASGSGIGGKASFPCGNIDIRDAIITVEGGNKSAGIGAAYTSTCGTISINNSFITATGGKYGAGIGTGYSSSSCGNIVIGGIASVITATGGNGGAGIGSGQNSYCSDITIDLGSVTATGGDSGAGIGCGYGSGGCGAITIGSAAKVVARQVWNNSNGIESIGKGSPSTPCTSVSIGEISYWDGSSYQNGGRTILTANPLIYPLPYYTVNNSNVKVAFAPTNLQYYSGKWRFPEYPWDYMGNDNYYSTTYSRIDLFGWGTSCGVSSANYTPVATCPYAWSTSGTDADYNPYESSTTNLYDGGTDAGKADWGYNAIRYGGNAENAGWRTPTRDEWNYLFNGRGDTYTWRYTFATVNGTKGVILFPDNYNGPKDNVTGITWGSINNASAWATTCTSSGWTTLENTGCIFLPAAGYRGTSSSYGALGYYWSSSRYDGGTDEQNAANAYCVSFAESSLAATAHTNRSRGCAVRLIHNL